MSPASDQWYNVFCDVYSEHIRSDDPAHVSIIIILFAANVLLNINDKYCGNLLLIMFAINKKYLAHCSRIT